MADLIAYGLFQKFEHGDDQYFDLMKNKFDSEGGVVHGLYVRQ